MRKGLVLTTLFCTSALYSAEFESNMSGEGNFDWWKKECWVLKSGEGKKGFPVNGDTVKILAQSKTSNFLIGTNYPKEMGESEMAFEAFSIDLSDAVTVFVSPDIKAFSVAKDFVKTTAVGSKDGKTVTNGKRGDFVLQPMYDFGTLDFSVKGPMTLSDEAEDRTSSSYFGGYSYFGGLRNESMLKSFMLSGDLNLRNQNFAVGTRKGENAEINGIVKFDDISPARRSALILNHDVSPEGGHLMQVLKVGGLQSVKEGAGIVATRTGMRKISDIDPLSAEGETATAKELMDKKRVGNDKIREGVIEIVGKGGDFSGDILDNITAGDNRGRVHVVMDAEDSKQILSGNLDYSGATTVKAGTLILSGKGKLGDLNIQDGRVGFMADRLSVENLNWSSGGFDLDLAKNKGIEVRGKANVSAMPEALDTFTFSNIKPRVGYTLVVCKDTKNAFSSFAGKKIEYEDAANGKVYEGIFGVSNSALTVVFMAK